MKSFAAYTSRMLLISLIILLSYAGPSQGEKLPIVIITVDVETKYYGDMILPLPEQVDAICINEVPCGLDLMIGLLNEKGYAATFFLNVYEHNEYGEGAIRDIAKRLDDTGQDVQLHTHPQWAYDKNREFMYQYSLKEQTRIIREGKEMLEGWIGKPVIAHRAGAYGADKNTLEALIDNEIIYDSSLFHGWPNSKINSLELKKNVLSRYGPLYEFPVTVYEKKESPGLLAGTLKSISRIRKYDINWFGDVSEAESALEESVRLGMDYVILFLHSFSFTEGKSENNEMKADVESISIFKDVLDFLSEGGFTVLSFNEIHRSGIDLGPYLNSPDIIPVVPVDIGLVGYFPRVLGINRTNYKAVALTSGLAFLLLAIFVVLVKKRSGRDG